ncbi:MAG TPA: hemolysin III family protein [Firmicutes bacterium]|nr:hemolysin III family protein [Bacillota bacterium]
MIKIRELSKGEEIANAVSHGIGIGLAIAALVILTVFAAIHGNMWHIVSFCIFGSTMVVLYTASTLYHSFPRGKTKTIFKIIDHACVFLLIAGTYTPLTLVTLRGTFGWSLFGVVWGIALLGIVFKLLFINKFHLFSTLLYIGMGWLIIIAIKPLINGLNAASLFFLMAGGILYTLGTIFYGLQKIKYNHVVWHLFVLAGSICHFFCILFILPI